MLSRRLYVFRCNMDMLVNQGRTYLWTFTLPELRDYVTMRKDWNRCLTYLRRQLGPEWQGIRVYEVHPGKWNIYSHGLHVHVVCNKFHDVNVVRAAAKAAGFGRVHVVKRRHSMGYYLAKYLSKPRPPALKGWRLWGCFNMPDRVRMKDVYLDSERSRLFRLGHGTGAFAGLNWAEKLQLVGLWVWQSAAGEPLHRPIIRRAPDIHKPSRSYVSRISPKWLDRFLELRRKQGAAPPAENHLVPCPATGQLVSHWGLDLRLSDRTLPPMWSPRDATNHGAFSGLSGAGLGGGCKNMQRSVHIGPPAENVRSSEFSSQGGGGKGQEVGRGNRGQDSGRGGEAGVGLQ